MAANSNDKSAEQVCAEILQKTALKRHTFFYRFGGKKISEALKLTDDELSSLDVTREDIKDLADRERKVFYRLYELDGKQNLTECDDPQKQLQKILYTLECEMSPDLPPTDMTIVTSMLREKEGVDGKGLDAETRKALQKLADDDLHGEDLMFAFGTYYNKKYSTEELQEWNKKCGGLSWEAPPTSRAEFLAHVSYRAIDEVTEGYYSLQQGFLGTYPRMWLQRCTMQEIKNAVKDCGIEISPTNDKVLLVASVAKCLYKSCARAQM